MFDFYGFKRRASSATVALGLLWSLFASSLLLYNGYVRLTLVYGIYLLVNLVHLGQIRRNLFSPRALLIGLTFLGFGLSIPLLAGGVYFGESLAPRFRERDMVNATVAVITLQLGFLTGIWLAERSKIPAQLKLQRPLKPPSPFGLACVVVGITAGCLFRILFHLGEAGTQPTIPFAGYFQYIFYDGALLLAVWYLARSLDQSSLQTTFAFVPFAIIALTHAYLGWRGAIFKIALAILVAYWFQDQNRSIRRPKSFRWLMVIAVAGVFVIEFGQSQRVARLGGDDRFADSFAGYVDKIWYRAQGTTRLMPVLRHFGGLSPFNDIHYLQLRKKDISAVRYIDYRLHGIPANVSHSIGPSGPGAAFTYLGLAGIFLAYLGIGGLLAYVFRMIPDPYSGRCDFTATSLYISLCLMCLYAIPENTEVTDWVIALIGISLVLRVFEKLFLVSRQPVFCSITRQMSP